MPEIKKPVSAGVAPIQAKRRTKINRLAQHPADGGMKFAALAGGQVPGWNLRRYAGLKKNFAGINISHPGHHGLVQ